MSHKNRKIYDIILGRELYLNSIQKGINDMKINKQQNDNELTISLEGRLDTNTSPDLEKELTSLDGITKLIFDLKGLEYISSAGLRIILSLQKAMFSKGNLIIK